MSPELKAATAFAIAALVTYVVTPICIKVAVRTGFFDLPAGYKGHQKPTPYLGGTAIVLGIVAAVMATDGGVTAHPLIIACAVGIWVMGTVDDKFNLPISMRTFAEVAIAVLLWATGRGWDVFHYAPADLMLTVVWVVGVMNAFNLMDNMDGAAASTAAVSALGAGALALISGDGTLAALAFGVAGACVAFLPRNLASRIFMGDGGSLVIGLLVARVTMAAVTPGYLGPSGVVVAALLVGLVIFDTTLVIVSRTRGRSPLLTGGRDHLTHRLARRLRDPRRVAFALAVTQLAVCGVTVGVARAGIGWVLLTGGFMIVAGVVLIWQFERSLIFGREEPGSGGPAELSDTLGPVTAARPATVALASRSGGLLVDPSPAAGFPGSVPPGTRQDARRVMPTA
jgi:UDP-GlcNAc:undecaprenyl-phosphate GlcNAc-1-phosphate transferase